MNKNKLKSIVSLHGETFGKLAKNIGIARSTLSLKVNGTNGHEFTQTEIIAIKEHYNLSAEEVDSIFFDKKVS